MRRAIGHGTQTLSAQQFDLQGIANAFVQPAMNVQNQQPIPPDALDPVQGPSPPAEPASGAAATAQPAAPSPTPSGAATLSEREVGDRMDVVREHTVFEALSSKPGSGDIMAVLRSTAGDVSATLKTVVVRAKLASVAVAIAAVAFASSAPVKSLSVDEVTDVFRKLKDRLDKEANPSSRHRVKRKTSDRISSRDVNLLMAGAWPEATTDPV